MPVSVASQIAVEEITRREALDALRPEWSALWSRCPSASPFQSPDWLIPWYRHFGSAPLWTLALRCAGRLVGLAPLFVWTDPQAVRRLLLIGTGITDHLDLLLEPGFERRGTEAVIGHWAEHRDRWDLCELRALPHGSPLLTSSVPESWQDDIAAESVCPVLGLPPRVEELPECIPARQLKALAYDRRRAAREGTVRYERAEESNFERLFETLLTLHHARWRQRDKPGVLAARPVQEFHRQVAWNMLRSGLLRLSALHIGTRPAAVLYGFQAHGQMTYYLGGFDPALKTLSPGVLIVGHAIEEAIRDGAAAFDFLRGREGYKYDWGARDQQINQRHLRHTPRERDG